MHMTLYPLPGPAKASLLTCLPMDRPQEQSVLQGELFDGAGTELGHGSWAVHRPLQYGTWPRVGDKGGRLGVGGPE